jgi:hypothetical protein
VKNEWSHTSTSPTRFKIMDKGTFTVTRQTFHTQPAVLTMTFHQNAPLTLLSISDHSRDATLATTCEEFRCEGSMLVCVFVFVCVCVGVCLLICSNVACKVGAQSKV